MKKGNIQGVQVIPLRKIPDERGTIFHMLRSSDKHFKKFGEIYFSKIYRNAIKGWHTHQDITLNYCCVDGMIKLVLFDQREDSPTHGNLMEIFMGVDNYVLVQIPVGVVNGHKGISETALLASCPDIPHDQLREGEMLRIDPHSPEIPYTWERRDN